MPPTHTDEGVRAAVALRAAYPAVGVLLFSQYVETRFAKQLSRTGSATSTSSSTRSSGSPPAAPPWTPRWSTNCSEPACATTISPGSPGESARSSR
jgi:hypothetical protein